MNLKIGEKIKFLRKKADVTQDRLAEYLCVTAQAVSRWESGICYPDIELLPALADFFGVSSDELLGVDASKKEDKISGFIEKANEAQCRGDFAEAVSVYRQAVAQFPSSHKLQLHLASAIGCIDNGEKIPSDAAAEAVNICERVLEDCVDDHLRYNALSILCWVYFRQMDDFEKAMSVADKLPGIFYCREYIQAETLKVRLPSEDAEKIVFNYIFALLISFNKPEFAYCNNKEVMLKILIEELQKLKFS